jgi:signal peptidase I
VDLFLKKLSDKLPPRRLYNYKIIFVEGAKPPFDPLYRISRDELLVLKKYLEKNLFKKFIRSSKSLAASPVIFIKKPSRGLRLYIDYRNLNRITVKNCYPIPLIRKILNRIIYTRFFTKLDIITIFNKIRIAEEDKWLIIFYIRYKLFEYLVIFFGLINTPASFQNLINNILRQYLDDFCTAYLDDILIYSKTLKEYKRHVRLILEILTEAGLYLDINKCEFHISEVKYLGLIISNKNIRIDPEKIRAIIE